jgi:hypothetical protein
LRLRRRHLIAPALACALAFLPAAGANASTADAERTLAEAQALLAPPAAGDASTYATGGSRGADATLLLRELQAALGDLDGADRRSALKLLERPGDGGRGDTFGKEAKGSPVCDANFCVHWTDKGVAAPKKTDKAPANGVPDFVDEVAAAAALSHSVENGTLGWREPLPDGTKGSRGGKGTAGETDIYLDALGSGLFGYATTDGRARGKNQLPGYLVVDNDYKGFSGTPVDLMRATMAHEYNHVVQFAIDLKQDGWMYESTATWMEEQVYPGINDYVNFLEPSIRFPQEPLAETDRDAFKLYGSAIWNHYLSAVYGVDVIRAAWEAGLGAKPRHFAVSAYDRAIRDAGGLGFSQEFVGFAAATAEWRSTTTFPDPGLYTDIKRSGALGKGRDGKLAHTGYRLFKVKRPASGDVTVELKLKRGVRGGVALIGRAGPVIGGVVESQVLYAPNGGSVTVTLPDAARFNRITALVANADGRLKPNGKKYRADNARYEIKPG